MRFFIMLTFLIVVFTCCQTEKSATIQDKIRAEVEAKIKPVMNDPDSYEFVGIALTDSVTYMDNINKMRRHSAQDLESNVSNASFERAMSKLNRQKPDDKLQISISQARKFIAGLDSIGRVMGKDTNQVASYTYLFRFRQKAPAGGKILTTYPLQTDQNYKVINVQTKESDRLTYPNTFPGYDQLKRKYLY